MQGGVSSVRRHFWGGLAGRPLETLELGGATGRHFGGGSRGCLSLRGRSTSARSAPGLVPDGAVRHAAQPELCERPDVVAFEAHQRNQHFVAVAVEDGGSPATARPGLQACWRGRRARSRKHRRRDLVEHVGGEDEQADLTSSASLTGALFSGSAVRGLPL